VWRFALLTAAGSLLWNAIFVFSGFFLGESWHIVERYADILQCLVIAVAAGAVAWFLFVRIRALLADRRAGGRAEPEAD
jgi:membrane protein DedA with SNARE-associated domain